MDPETARIEALLAEETAALEALAEVLQRERAALAAGLGDGIEQLAEEKEAHAVRLARLGQDREALLAARGVAGGTPELLARTAWRQLTDKARTAKTLNEENGLLIGLHSRHLQARLAALAAANPAATYGPDGGSRPSAGRRALGAA